MPQNFFEKNPKFILLGINIIFIAAFFFITTLKIFQDSPSEENYSLLDKAAYQIRCHGKRNVALRENKPNQNSFRIPPYNTSQKFNFRTDENGFISPSKIHDNPDVNIFFLGGSTTECEYADEPYRFPYLVGRILEKKTGKKINSYNGGKSGNNSIHSLNNLVNKVLPLNPNIVVLMENINDLSTLLYEATYWNRNVSRSNLGCFSKNSSSLRNFKNEWAASPFKNLIPDHSHQEKVKSEYRKILTLFITVTKAAGATPVIMTQFNKIETHPDFTIDKNTDKAFDQAYRRLYIDLHNTARQVAKENNVLLIDLARNISGTDQYLYDSVHLNSEGSRIVAEFIAQKLQKTVTNF